MEYEETDHFYPPITYHIFTGKEMDKIAKT